MQIMTSYIMYDILKPSVLWKIWRRGTLNFISGGGLWWPWTGSVCIIDWFCLSETNKSTKQQYLILEDTSDQNFYK